uniref:PABS domain-containing protein n=1 Tax=Globodera pallida TaxID=36090 RepID=A0A183C527_GLOPA
MNLLHNEWYTEFSPDDAERIAATGDGQSKMMKLDGAQMSGAWTGQAFSLHVDKVLFSGRSKFQDVLVFKSKAYGNVLVLDGAIQTTDRDEFAYQEMLTHLPICSHPNPKQVLIVGGGDGGILREVLKHRSVERVVIEIDEMVVKVAKQFLHGLSAAFDSPKLQLHIGDGFEFLKGQKDQFDVIITDSSDPIGPAESLFGKAYYQLVSNALKDGGVLASQAESIWLHLPLISKMVNCARELFPSVAYASASVPTYPSGTIGYLVASKRQEHDLTVPLRPLDSSECRSMGLKFYNHHLHSASFVLPNFAKEALNRQPNIGADH